MFKTLTQLLRRSCWILPQTTFDPGQGRNDFAVMARNISFCSSRKILVMQNATLCATVQDPYEKIQECAVRAKQLMGLATNNETPAVYSHGNSLCENKVG